MASSSTWCLHVALLLAALSSVAGNCSRHRQTQPVCFGTRKWGPDSGITLSQGAFFADNGSFVQLVGPGFPQSTSAGAFHSDAVPFIDPCTGRPASFNTSFTFAIQGPAANNPVPGPADGLAFVIAPTPNVSASSAGEHMGIFDENLPNWDPAIKTVAVEIDTFQNGYDPAVPHIGLDINSIVSNVTADASAIVTDGPGAPQKVTVWVDYDACSHSLAVFAAKAPARKSQAKLLLSLAPLILTSIINPRSYVGFSAASGGASENNFVYSWSFKSCFSPCPSA